MLIREDGLCMKSQLSKSKLRSSQCSAQGEFLGGGITDSSFSNDERSSSIDRSQSVQAGFYDPTGLQGNSTVMLPLFASMPPQHSGAYYPALFQGYAPGVAFLERGGFAHGVPLSQFKTIECTLKENHEHKQCPYFHTLKDRRRDPNKFNYEPELCPAAADQKPCSKQDKCQFAHNSVEVFYHIKRYKTKLCAQGRSQLASAVSSRSGSSSGMQKPSGKCGYAHFCSFAHCEEELKIKLLHRCPRNADFFRFLYKTVYCPFNHPHDKSTCEYAHNVQDYRRDPKTTVYKPETFKKWNVSAEITKYEDGGCNYNEACDKCHGWKELEYHPKFYKTKPCSNGDKCTRKDCGYIHPHEQKRVDTLKEEKMLRESQTSAASHSKHPRLKLSESHHSLSKDEGMLTFNSSSISHRERPDMASIMGRDNDDDHRGDLRSIPDLDAAKPRLTHALTELGMDDTDADSKSVCGKLQLSQKVTEL